MFDKISSNLETVENDFFFSIHHEWLWINDNKLVNLFVTSLSQVRCISMVIARIYVYMKY